jgi:hypothetical protein
MKLKLIKLAFICFCGTFSILFYKLNFLPLYKMW